MFWKVNYEYKGKKDAMWYGGAVTKEEKNNRLKKLKELGFNILSCYKVKKMQ